MKPAQLAGAALGVFVASCALFAVLFYNEDRRPVFGAPILTTSEQMGFAYGPLGKPNWSDADHPDISKRSPQENLAEFRWWIRHPPKGTADHFVGQYDFDAFDNRQRSLFYEVAKRAPQLLMRPDLKVLREAEADLYESSCAGRNVGDPMAPYKLTRQQCIPYGIAEARREREQAEKEAKFEATPEGQRDEERRIREGKRVRDLLATGSEKASAEWRSVSHPSVSCGITPSDRYLIVHNEIGNTKYDEPSNADWRQLGCANSEPVVQEQIIQAAQQREAKKFVFEHTHHVDADCALRLARAMTEGTKDTENCWRSNSADAPAQANR